MHWDDQMADLMVFCLAATKAESSGDHWAVYLDALKAAPKVANLAAMRDALRAERTGVQRAAQLVLCLVVSWELHSVGNLAFLSVDSTV